MVHLLSKLQNSILHMLLIVELIRLMIKLSHILIEMIDQISIQHHVQHCLTLIFSHSSYYITADKSNAFGADELIEASDDQVGVR